MGVNSRRLGSDLDCSDRRRSGSEDQDLTQATAVACQAYARAARARQALMNSQTTGRTEMKTMMRATAEKFCFDDRDVAEDVTQAEARGDPEDGAGDVVEGEGAVAHVAGAGDKRHERANDGHEACYHDRLAAVLLEERVRLFEVLAVEQAVQAAALVVRGEHLRPERPADAVVDGVADDGRREEHASP